MLNKQEQHNQTIAVKASQKKPVQTQLLVGEHNICEQCGGTGITATIQKGPSPWEVICSYCGGRGVTKLNDGAIKHANIRIA
jgi:DnaJ-class molecular chaperone